MLGFSVAGCLPCSGQRGRRARVRAHPCTHENAQGTAGEQGLWVPRGGLGVAGSEATLWAWLAAFCQVDGRENDAAPHIGQARVAAARLGNPLRVRRAPFPSHVSISRACDARKRQGKNPTWIARVAFVDSSSSAKAPTGRPSETTIPK